MASTNMRAIQRHPRLLRLCAHSFRATPYYYCPVRSFTSGDNNDNDYGAWKPPNKPLVGDIGMSHKYRHVEDAEVLHQLEAEMKELEDKEEDTDDPHEVVLEDSDDDDEPVEVLDDADSDEEDDRWVRPRRELGSIREQVYAEDVEIVQVNEGDRYQNYLDKQNNPQMRNELEIKTDWLQTRREMLADGPKMMKPDAAKLGMQAVTELPVKHHTLLGKDEIIGIAETLGGLDIRVILDDKENPRMGVAKGFILVTLETHRQRVTLAETLKRQLRNRRLHEVGVVGAALGIEGSLNDPDETWLVLDCNNYIVHILDGQTRAMLKIEKLWTGHDKLFQLDVSDEDAVDEYVAENQAPVMDQGVDNAWLDAMKILKRARSTVPKPEPQRRQRNRNRRAGKRF